MKSYSATTHAEHLRLTILRLLADGGLKANESILADGVNAMGFNVGRDRVRTALSWLEEQQLVKLTDVEGMTVAEIRQRGVDVATGRARVPGVKRPGPKD